MAPELLLNNKYDYAMDIWSIGCIMGELLLNFVERSAPSPPPLPICIPSAENDEEVSESTKDSETCKEVQFLFKLDTRLEKYWARQKT